MPNSANRSKGSGNANQGQPKHRTSRSDSDKPNLERSDLKRDSSDNRRQGTPDRTSNQGRKQASGGSANE